ncbi:hypothetical protein GOC74_04250 [Halomicrobium mukohataei]|uniref:Uncharacterized protein n=1 Tax=Halomicrobium mukohataei TaxID=57705 RepID=A0A847U835_9EURY|nr:hypothetical protein [Halomicrobium mukohataei]NLV09139.1 hypothetical protein [Halomicrobium mukohataei]
MGAAESLAALIGALSPDEVNIANDVEINVGGNHVDVDDVEGGSVRVGSGDNTHKIEFQEDKVEIYPNELQGEEYALFSQLVRQTKKESGSVDRISEHEEKRALEEANKDVIDETISFFDGLISGHYISLLRSCLYLNQAADRYQTSHDFDVEVEKRELKEKYGYEAYYVANLASSGYFGEGRYFRDLYHRLEEREGNAVIEYKEEFELTIGEELLAVYVSSDDNAEYVKHQFRGRVAKQFRHNPMVDFIDVCGFGEDCENVIEAFIEDIEEEYPSVEYESPDRGQEIVRRIYPGTLRSF